MIYITKKGVIVMKKEYGSPMASLLLVPAEDVLSGSAIGRSDTTMDQNTFLDDFSVGWNS